MKNNQELFNATDEVAEKMYDSSYYKSTSQTEKGLSVTHEQVSDVYVEGTNDGNIEENTGENNM